MERMWHNWWQAHELEFWASMIGLIMVGIFTLCAYLLSSPPPRR